MTSLCPLCRKPVKNAGKNTFSSYTKILDHGIRVEISFHSKAGFPALVGSKPAYICRPCFLTGTAQAVLDMNYKKD